MSRNPQSLWRTEHEDTQGQREETGTVVPSGDGHGGHSRDGTLTQDNMSLMRERRGGGREGGRAGWYRAPNTETGSQATSVLGCHSWNNPVTTDAPVTR